MLMLLALIGLTAAGYAHLHLPRFIATRSGVAATRAILLVVGAAFGYVAMLSFAGGPLQWLAFLAGFGAVHVPPAIVLLIKRARHSPKS